MKKPKSNQPQQQYMQNPYMSPNYPYYMPQPQQPQPGGQPQVQGQSQGGPPPTSSGGSGAPQDPNQLPIEESYIENILRLNRGKIATVYMTFENNTQWNAKVFRGIIEAAGRDHIILSDPQTGTRYVLLMVYLDYITFDEEIKYNYPFGGGGQQLSNYSPR
ncbi:MULTISPECIES: spore coat protein GerQ [Priestia]|uniref:Spore coat protein GerQ n=3 Tax=Priestia TaxID=2800373 RepID=A0AAX6BS89_PRIMG|nr:MULTISPECIES: spore coat protein GerQ [Priestia]MBK0294902.1 spore coat protein GerQ [Bacillus sp. S34]MCL9637179.1 spore coat protein GerQ [Bacillus zanthoxyli]NHH91782.1 Spore coat protein GerQ [Bacillus sp. MB95]AKP80177.1 Spore coat protein GerQ [Priestia megaterium Q3]AWD64963.1 spore coat protein GerQ [Priestia megaterium]